MKSWRAKPRSAKILREVVHIHQKVLCRGSHGECYNYDDTDCPPTPKDAQRSRKDKCQENRPSDDGPQHYRIPQSAINLERDRIEAHGRDPPYDPAQRRLRTKLFNLSTTLQFMHN